MASLKQFSLANLFNLSLVSQLRKNQMKKKMGISSSAGLTNPEINIDIFVGIGEDIFGES